MYSTWFFLHRQPPVNIPLQLHEIPTRVLCGPLPAIVWRETLVVAVDAVSATGIFPSILSLVREEVHVSDSNLPIY